MNKNGKGSNNRKNKHRFSNKKDDSYSAGASHSDFRYQTSAQKARKQSENLFSDGKYERNKQSIHERLQWTAPKLPVNPITTPDCKWCGKKITDIATAICEKESGQPVHFDCVLARISQMENLETNDSICYIGGGRFGVVHYNNPPDTKNFTIKKIIEWEIKDTNTNSDWRRPISEYFSIT